MKILTSLRETERAQTPSLHMTFDRLTAGVRHHDHIGMLVTLIPCREDCEKVCSFVWPTRTSRLDVFDRGDVRGADPEEAGGACHRSGIGAEFSIVPGRGLLITEVFETGPAERSGLKPGDLVVSMDDHPFTGLSPAKIHTQVMHNKADSSIFDVRRTDGEVRRLAVERGPYKLPVVRIQDEEYKTPIARVPFFGHGTADALADWLKDHRSAGAVVLDLRDNEGGSLEEVVKAADLFLEPGAIVVNRGQHGEQLEPVTASTNPSWVRNVVVLVNQGTSGVAEAFAAALRDNGRCVLVGTRTGGRAVDSSVYDVGRGFVLQVADIHLATPSGNDWGKRGLAPNVVVEATDFAVPVGETGRLPDLQRDTAIRLISSVR